MWRQSSWSDPVTGTTSGTSVIWGPSTVMDARLWSLLCLDWHVFSIAYFPTLPPTLSNTPVKTWKVINKCPLCWRTNTDGIWLTHGGLAEPWAGQGSRQPIYKEPQACVGVRIFLNNCVSGVRDGCQTYYCWDPMRALLSAELALWFAHLTFSDATDCQSSHGAMVYVPPAEAATHTSPLAPLVLWGRAGQQGGGRTENKPLFVLQARRWLQHWQEEWPSVLFEQEVKGRAVPQCIVCLVVVGGTFETFK